MVSELELLGIVPTSKQLMDKGNCRVFVQILSPEAKKHIVK